MFLSKPARRTAIPILVAAVLITSCNFGATPAPTTDVNALSTALVGTTVAQFGSQLTQTAQAAPTNTAEPTEAVALLPLPTTDTSGAPSPTIDVSSLATFSFDITAVPTLVTVLDTPASGLPTVVSLPTSTTTGGGALGDACDNMQFLYDVNYSDGTMVNGGETFTKIWAVKNTGSCTWDQGYALLLVGRDPAVGAYDYKFSDKKTQDFVPGGTETQLGVSVTAPCAPGKYSATWRLQNDRGYYFGGYLSVYFEVGTTKVGGCK